MGQWIVTYANNSTEKVEAAATDLDEDWAALTDAAGNIIWASPIGNVLSILAAPVPATNTAPSATTSGA